MSRHRVRWRIQCGLIDMDVGIEIREVETDTKAKQSIRKSKKRALGGRSRDERAERWSRQPSKAPLESQESCTLS